MSEIHRILGDAGELLGDELKLHGAQLLEFWRFMVLGRELDLAFEKLRAAGRIGPYVSSAGAEACAVGATAAMSGRDWLFSSWRFQAAALVRDLEPATLADNALGNERDRARGRQGPLNLSFASERVVPVSAPVGTQIVQAVGAAHAAKLRGDEGAAVALFGSAAMESGDYHTGLNFAGVMKAPVVFVALGDQDLSAAAQAYGIAAQAVDGDDVLAVYAGVSAALERARGGEGGTIVSAIGGRPDVGIERLRMHLLESEAMSDELEEQIGEEARHEARAAVESAKAQGFPPAATLFEDVLGETDQAIAWQKDAQARFGAEYGGEEDPDADNICS